MEPFGKTLKALRLEKGLTLNGIERKTGVSRANLKRAEDGIERASDNMLRDIAPLLGVAYETLKARRIMSELTPAEYESLKKEICDKCRDNF